MTSSPGPFGYGWSSTPSLNTTTLTVTQASGAQVTFTAPRGGSCAAPTVGPGTTGTYSALPYVTASPYLQLIDQHLYVHYAPLHCLHLQRFGTVDERDPLRRRRPHLDLQQPVPGLGFLSLGGDLVQHRDQRFGSGPRLWFEHIGTHHHGDRSSWPHLDLRLFELQPHLGHRSPPPEHQLHLRHRKFQHQPAP